MKALIVEKPGSLSVRDIPEPPMGPYTARCKMLYGATCTGTDLHVIDGTFAEHVDYPSVIGHESIGVVVEVGSKVRNFKVGDWITRVGTRAQADGSVKLSWGGMCEYGLAVDTKAAWLDGVDPKEWNYFCINQVIPAGIISPELAPMIITWRETMSFIHRFGVTKGSRILISGSGGNALSHAAMSAICGASEVAMIGSASRKEAALKVGVTKYIDYRDAAAIEAYAAEAAGSFDFLLDATGKAGSLNRLMCFLQEGGKVSVYGMDDYNTYTLNPLLGPKSFSIYNGGYYEPETHDEIIDLIRAGRLDASVWIDTANVFTWDNAPEAYAHVRAKKAIKSIIKLSQD